MYLLDEVQFITWEQWVYLDCCTDWTESQSRVYYTHKNLSVSINCIIIEWLSDECLWARSITPILLGLGKTCNLFVY